MEYRIYLLEYCQTIIYVYLPLEGELCPHYTTLSGSLSGFLPGSVETTRDTPIKYRFIAGSCLDSDHGVSGAISPDLDIIGSNKNLK